MAVDAGEEEEGGGEAHEFGDGEGPPDGVDVAGEAQEVCRREQHQQLAEERHDRGIDAVAQRLETGTQGDAQGREGEAPADRPEGGGA